MGSRSRIHKLPTRNVDPQTAPTQKHSREKDKGWTTRSARPAHTLPGEVPTPRRAREKTCSSCRSAGQAPPRAGAPPGRPFPQLWPGGKRARAPSRSPPPGVGEGRGPRGRAFSSCVLAYVAGLRLRPSRRPPVTAAAAAALSFRRPPPEGGRGQPPPGCRGCTSAA